LLWRHQPPTVIAGSSDAICFPAANSYLAKNIPGSQSDAIFIEIGHAPFLTRPGEFDAALRSALDKRAMLDVLPPTLSAIGTNANSQISV